MDKSQADAVAEAMLASDPKSCETLLRKRAHENWWLVEKRKVALLALVGFAVGAAAASFFGERFTSGGLWGAIVGGSVGWLWIWLRSRRRAA